MTVPGWLVTVAVLYALAVGGLVLGVIWSAVAFWIERAKGSDEA